MTAPIFYPLLSAVPMGVLAAMVKAWRWLHEAKGLRVPLREKLLRAPGESVRRKKEDLDDRIIDSLVYVVGIPPTLVICYLVMTRTAPAPSGGFWATFLFMAVAGYGVLVVRLLALLESRANQRSCFSAEKSVGQDLNRLMAGGFQVFHDFPLDAKDKISHIVVAPCGVFSVETRTRPKGDPARRQKAHEVIYDGKGLQFPGHYDKENLIQARNHAKSLSALLGHALGATIPVKPVLTFPGWTVTAKTPGDVLVVNPKTIRSAITSDAQPVLSEDQMRQIAEQLDQKCRDVEF